MTDEEMAKDYAEHNLGKYTNEFGNLYHAFLAGFKAGKDMAETDLATIAYMQGAERYRTKWHDLRKDSNDLPTCDCEIVTLHENGNKNIQKWKNGNWTNAIIIPVIAWYELLKFEEE